MGIVFFCQSCGARFEVDPRMAGKTGRCKKCGQTMSIPRAEQIASIAAMPALAAARGWDRRRSWCTCRSRCRRPIDRGRAQGRYQQREIGAAH